MLYILNVRQEIVGVAVNGSPHSLPYTQDVHYETLEGISSYEFIVPANHEKSNLVENEGYVIIRDMDGFHILFKIKEIMDNYEDNVPVKRVVCENAAISELLGDVQRPINLKTSSLEATVTSVMSSANGWVVGDVDYLESRDFIIEDYITVLEAINKIAEEYDCEYFFTVELDGTTIKKKVVNFVEQRGNETDLRFDYGHHLRNVSRTVNSENVITALVAVGKGDTDGKRLTLINLPAFNDGNFYKESGADWIGSEKALQQWSNDGNHIFGVKVFDTAESIENLKSLALWELEYRSQPSVVYATTTIDVERMTGFSARKIRLGDTVIVKDTSFEPAILISGRVQELKRSYTNSFEFNDDIKLGNYKTIENKVPASVVKIQNAISLKEETWNKIEAEISSTGGDVFKNGSGSTVLNVRVFQGGKEIDLDGTQFTYTWKMFDKDSNLTSWSKVGKSITILDTDVTEKATFEVDID